MVKISYPLPKPSNENITTISNEVVVGDTTIEVVDASALQVDDIILLQEYGDELSEIAIIESINGNTLTVTEPVVLPHDVLAPISVLQYNEYEIVRKDSNDTTLHRDVFDYGNQYNHIIFYDDSEEASYNKAYILRFHNSVTEDSEDIAIDLSPVGYVSVKKLYNDFDISEATLRQSAMISAIKAGAEVIRDEAFRRFTAQAFDKDSIIKINFDGWTFADWNSDGEIGADDMYVFEYNAQENRTIFINHKISKIITRPGHEAVVFSEKVPRQNYSLNFYIRTAYKELNEMSSVLARVNQLLAANYILQNTNNRNVRDGVLSWSAGGTSVNRDSGSVERVIENNEKAARNLLQKHIAKTYLARTKLRRRGTQFQARYPGQVNRSIDGYPGGFGRW